MEKRRPSSLWPRVLAVLLAAAAAGLLVSWAMFSSWSTVQRLDVPDAEARVEERIAALADARPYLAIGPTGEVSVDRSLEAEEEYDLRALVVLLHEPGPGRVAEIRFPFWFVRVKLSDTVGLGTLTSALSGDWEHLDLEVAEDELARRGPGLILDHTRGDGARLLVWTE